MADLSERVRASLAGRYTIERELGRGGMATVYLARDVKHDRPVALKVLRPELAAVLGAERFLREIRLTAQLQHPHILTLIDSGEADGFLYYVMPYVEGESLRQRLEREGQLPLDEALRITRAIASALDFAHARGVIHRDIKPENIMLHQGEPMVADFGIALAVSTAGRERLTETGLSLGTPAYMSPEQASAEPRLDGRSDQYSLASVLYEMLAGEPPYTGHTAQAIIAKRLAGPIPCLSTVRAVPEAVEAAVTKALAKAAADRFYTAGELALALENAGAQPRRLLRRKRRAVLGGIALLALAVALAMASRIASRRATGPVAQRQFTFTGKATLPALSPDGLSVAYVVGWRSLVVQRLDDGDPVVLVPPVRFITSVRWTGDGKAIVIDMMPDSTELAATYLVSSSGGPTRKVLDDFPPFDTGPDTTVVIRAPREKHRLEFVSLLTRRASRTIPLADSLGEVTEVAWSPDRRWIAFAAGGQFSSSGPFPTGGRLWVVAVDGGAPTAIVDEGRNVRWAPGSDALYFLRGSAGAVDLVKVGFDPKTGGSSGNVTRMMSLPTADAFDIAPTNRLVYTHTNPGLHAHALVFSGTRPRRVVEERSLTEGTTQAWHAAISADGQWVAYSRSRGGEVDIHVVSFAGGPDRAVASSPAEELWPSWSPDGARLAYTRADSSGRALMVSDTKTGASQRLGSVPGPGGFYGGAGPGLWSADGRYLAYFSQELRRISLVDLDRQSEAVIRIPDSIGTGYFFVVPSPDGSQVVASTLIRWTDWGDLWLVSRNGQRWRRLRGPFGESYPIAWSRDGWLYLINNRALFTDYGPPRLELWRMHGPDGLPELYAPLPEGCGLATNVSADGRRGVCAYVRNESDLYVASNFDPGLR